MPIIHAIPRRSEPWRLPFPTHSIIRLVCGKDFRPPERWTAEEFARHGERLLRVMHRLAQLTQRKAVPHVAATVKKVMRKQIVKVVERVTRRPVKASLIELMLPSHAQMWQHALDDVIRESGLDMAIDLMPPIQSVMGRANSVTNALLNEEGNPAENQRLQREAREIAQKIGGINETTRQQFGRLIDEAIDKGLTVQETGDMLIERFPQVAGSRALTIARTELNNAYNKGSTVAMQESETVSHVSVIGCESREPERWSSPSYQQFMYRGESTCNIQDVPIHDADKLNFHPNHTGTIVPSGFR